jgi:hypothetical protein
MCLEHRASLKLAALRRRRSEMVHWFRLIHFNGKAALNVFEGEDHRKAARETHDKAFHLRQRVKANWRTLLQDQHRVRLANMLSGPLSLHELLSQHQPRTSHSAHHGQRRRIFSTPGDPAHLLRIKQGTRNKETAKTASRHSTSTPSCRAAALSPVRGRPN